MTALLSNGLLTLLRMMSNLVVGKVVAIYAGPNGLALAGQLQAFNAALTGLVAAPAGPGLVRYSAENRDGGAAQCAPWWSACARWSLLLFVAAAPPACLFSHGIAQWLFRDASYAWLIVLVVVLTPLSMASIAVPSLMNGLGEHRRYYVAGSAAILVATAAAVAVAVRYGFAGALIVAATFPALLGGILLLASARNPSLQTRYWTARVGREHWKGLGDYVAMAAATAVLLPGTQTLVRNIIFAHGGWDDVGHWQAAQKVSDAYLQILTSSLGFYYLPRLARLGALSEVRREIANTLRVIAPLAIAGSACIFLTRDLIVRVLYSSEFSAAADYLVYQCVGDVFKALSLIYAYVILSRGSRNWFIALEFFFSALLAGTTLIFVRSFGSVGASMGYALTYLLYLLVVSLGLRAFSKWR